MDQLIQKYADLLSSIKDKIISAQAKAALSVNSALIELYWQIGKMIAENQAHFEGRSNYVEKLSKDLIAAFPDMKGFSKRNIFYCRRFYLFYAESSMQQLAALNEDQIPTMSVQQLVALKQENSVQQAY